VAVATQAIIAELWLERILRTCPHADFLAAERDPFRNPVGHTIRKSVAALVGELSLCMNRDHVREALDPIMQIRAVQDLPPSQALEFLFQLKDILRQHGTGDAEGLLDNRIDDMALMAFDLYLKYRERTYAARANEARRRVYVLEERLRPKARTEWHERCKT
jgi:hypothetical protein